MSTILSSCQEQYIRIGIAIVIYTTIYHVNIYSPLLSCFHCGSGLSCVHAKLYKYEGVLDDSTQRSDQPWKVREDVLPFERMKQDANPICDIAH